MSLSIPKCEICRWEMSEPDEPRYRCPVYPDRIPLDVLCEKEETPCNDKYRYEYKGDKKGS